MNIRSSIQKRHDKIFTREDTERSLEKAAMNDVEPSVSWNRYRRQTPENGYDRMVPDNGFDSLETRWTWKASKC